MFYMVVVGEMVGMHKERRCWFEAEAEEGIVVAVVVVVVVGSLQREQPLLLHPLQPLQLLLRMASSVIEAVGTLHLHLHLQ